MTKLISHSGNAVYVGHFQGNAMKKSMEVVEEYSTNKIAISPRIAVIMAFTDKSKAITALQLELNNIEYVNACNEEVTKWSNVMKIKYYINALEKTIEEYSLLVDAYDVLFFKDLDEEFIYKFNQMNIEVLYNATKNNYPNIEIEDNNKRGELSDFKYLNAGVVFGKTEDLLKLYKEILEVSDRKTIMNPWNSEQLYVRIAVEEKKHVGIDTECKLFQTFSKTTLNKIGNTTIII